MRLLPLLAFGLTLLWSGAAFAAPKDAQAQKAVKQAMEEDYLDTKFDDAEKKLKKALDACGASGCAPAVKARVYLSLGIVNAGGQGKKDEAKEAFVKALELDNTVVPDPDYVTADITTAFEDAKKKVASAGTGTGSGTPEAGPLTLAPVPEQRIKTPVPIHVSMDEEVQKQVTRMKLFYSPVGGGGRSELQLERSGKAFRGNIPCTATGKMGTLKYWILARDKNNKVVESLGSESEPLTTDIVSELSSKAPSWPGFAPPEACGASEEAGSSKRQCVDDADCPTGERCATNECLKKPSGDGDIDGGSGGSTDEDEDDGASDDARMNWFSLTFSPDFAMISGDDVCGFQNAYSGGTPEQAYDPSVICARNADSENPPRYLGQPVAGQGNNVNFGIAVSTLRLNLGYDRVLVEGLSLGARIGFAFNGTSYDFASFIPVHAEGRLAYTIGADPFSGAVVRPWVFIAGGLSQIDAAVDVDVLENGEACGADDPGDVASPCTIGTADGAIQPRIQTLRAIKQAGLGFVGAGAGVSFLPAQMFAINLGLKFSITVPVVVPVLSPEVGVGVGF